MISQLLLFLSFLSLLSPSLSQLRATLIDCGSTVGSTIDGRRWHPDTSYISVGTPTTIATPVLDPTLSTVRSFPLQNNLHKKFCYAVPVYRGSKYMVRTTYFYGGINGVDSPPVFDQMVDGTLWSVVNTTADYSNGMASYYEGVFEAQGKSMSVCVGVNIYTDSDPFISALEFVILGDSLYNSTDFKSHGLSLVSRHIFGYSGPIIRYPDDRFDRFWEPYLESKSTPASNNNVPVRGFWNLPPSKVFDTVLASNQSEPIDLIWPQVSLPTSTYYIALYFANNHGSSSTKSRMFSITFNGVTYYKHLNVTKEGVAVFSTMWPLTGTTKLTLTPAVGSNDSPLINGGEVFSVLALGGRTLTRDVIALEKIKSSLQNPPLDWNGDPCFPREYSWTGVNCSEGPRIRVVTLNLTSMGLSGSLSASISNLTALTSIELGNNTLSGSIPDLSSLRMLEILHLEDNQLSGEIPPSLGNMASLNELFLQNNNLTGQVPSSLIGKPGLNLRTSPGNQLVSPRPS
ncbi:LRR_1 domain-containing protein/LRRNT_2 domain-containing protein/Malectin_like domain-containing protein [Cephalotus follicularis]|uniref:LRR_1 domain-containing protein/LRRNT_2 domain-containing protein/Malectin_like domain-containing protein n=1 Tax=Cephalotus follicularis TaxID=3775 RepID=A0A1Q3C420_CEPFO|nr:LRR_1 domain-containing protein/LRRNT_2 domain-containing protein/Malectin_like domain-containing protein [Cephalotus follicularis]